MISVRKCVSRILRGLPNKDFGLEEDVSVGDLTGFRLGTILPSFQMLEKLVFRMEK